MPTNHINPAVTRFKNGVTNTTINKLFGNYPDADPTKLHVFFDDFDTFNTNKWTITETQAGATQALTDGDGGQILLTNSAANADANIITVGSTTPVVINSTKQHWFKCRLKTDDATNAKIFVGLQDTKDFSPSQYVLFYKLAATTSGSFEARGAGGNSASVSGVATLVANTFLEVAWYYDGNLKLYGFVDGVLKGIGTAVDATHLPTSNMYIFLGVQNTTAAARTLTIDYAFFAQER